MAYPWASFPPAIVPYRVVNRPPTPALTRLNPGGGRQSPARPAGEGVNASSGWATQHLAEFLAVVTAAADDRAAVEDGLQCLASAFGADACAFLRYGSITSSR